MSIDNTSILHLPPLVSDTDVGTGVLPLPAVSRTRTEPEKDAFPMQEEKQHTGGKRNPSGPSLKLVFVILGLIASISVFLATIKLSSRRKAEPAAFVGYEATFIGRYEQDGNISNGDEAIEWLILDRKDDKLLVISKYCLENLYYDENARDPLFSDWETSTIRTWLNGSFYHTAFSEQERSRIVLSDVSAYDDTGKLNDTKDYLFLLAGKEVNRYFTAKEDKYARQTRAVSLSDGGDSLVEYAEWWLRITRNPSRQGPTVTSTGSVTDPGYRDVHGVKLGVRPAMWIMKDGVSSGESIPSSQHQSSEANTADHTDPESDLYHEEPAETRNDPTPTNRRSDPTPTNRRSDPTPTNNYNASTSANDYSSLSIDDYFSSRGRVWGERFTSHNLICMWGDCYFNLPGGKRWSGSIQVDGADRSNALAIFCDSFSKNTVYVGGADRRLGEGYIEFSNDFDGDVFSFSMGALSAPALYYGPADTHGYYRLKIYVDGKKQQATDWLDYRRTNSFSVDVTGAKTIRLAFEFASGSGYSLNAGLYDMEFLRLG